MSVTQQWQVLPVASAPHFNRFSHMPRSIAQILYNRGITDVKAAEQFVGANYVDDNPFTMKGMMEAVTALRQAIRDRDPIAVYGDFDADGVTATAVLVETLSALQADVQPYIPHRVDEGYGLNTEALDELIERGVRLVVTVDCGVRAVDEVRHAVQRGLKVIVTDHHSVGAERPPALALVNPKQPDCPYPFDELAGVGIAYKLAQALLRSHQQVPITSKEVNLTEEDLLDLVAIGTVADLVPLKEENRKLVRQGLGKINQGQRPGLLALIRRSGLKLGQVDASSIGFGLGPRINAAGRLADARVAYRLLVAQYPGEADKLAEDLNQLNRRRQAITRETQEQARQQALVDGEDVALLFAASPEFLAGIVGLAAGRLCEEFYRPAIVVHMGDECSRGSARSIREFHITDALDACQGLLVRHGGHAAAAGFTVENRHLSLLARRLRDLAAESLAGKTLRPSLSIDVEMDLGELNRELLDWLEHLEPCGYGNPSPIFMTRRVHVLSSRAVGSQSSHLKMVLGDGRRRHDAIAFRQGHWMGRLPSCIDVAYQFELNRWNGRERLQLNVQDLRAAE